MALTQQQIEQVSILLDKYIMENRPPEEIRSKLDLGWRLEDQSVYLFEIRPRWDDETVIGHHDFAKATWAQSSKEWKVYWLRASGKWELYKPLERVGNLQRFLMEVGTDPHHCFKG